MVSTATIRKTIDIRGTSSGLDETKQKLVALGAAQDNVGASSDKMAKSQLSLEQAMANLARISEQNARQYQQMVQMQRTAADAQMRAMNDNNKSISENGLEWAEWTNHIKTAGEAAYLLSPKFRGLVNSLKDPALNAATTGIEAAATGIVRGTNLAGKGLVELGVATARSSTMLAPFAEQMALTGAAMAAWSPTLTGVAASILGKFLPAITALLRIVAPILLIKDAIQLVAEAWSLGGQKLEEYRQIAEKAAAVDLSTTYFQKITKAATDAKMPVDELTGAFKKLNDATTEKLGGSDLQQRLDQHLKAGNFKGNTGVTQLGQANTTEERFRAVVSLIDQAMQKGERLAALDISNTAFGPQVTENLRKDSEYLDRLVQSADKVSGKDIVSDADVGRALDLQRRYDAAVTILEQRWHPIQDLLTQLGIRMQEIWVGIVEAIANAVDAVVKLGAALFDKIPSGFWDLLKNGIGTSLRTAAGAAVGGLFGPLGIGAGIAISQGIGSLGGNSTPVPDAKGAAVNQLAAGMKNPADLARARAEANSVLNNVLKDTSHTIDDNKKKQQDANDAVDRAINSVSRHVEQQKADAAAVGLGAAALAEFRVQAAETAAVQANGGKETAEQAAQFAKLKTEAGAAADALAKAKIDYFISRGQQTALLSPEDVQIANQLKERYPDVATALASVEAEAIRVNNTVRDLATLGQDVSRSFAVDFETAIRNGTSALDALKTAGLNALGKIADKLTSMAVDNLWSKALGGGSSGGFNLLSLLGVGTGAVNANGSIAGAVGPTSVGGAPLVQFATGGFTGPGGKYDPAGIVHRGEYVFDAASTSRIGVTNLDRLRGYADGGYVAPSSIPMPRFFNDNVPQRVLVSVAVSVDDDGKLIATVKDVSQQTTADGISAYSKSSAFVNHVAAASAQGGKRRLRA